MANKEWKHKSPFFTKIKFNEDRKKDKGHVKYIANRPGVEKVAVGDREYINYINERPKSTGLFGPDADNPPVVTDVLKEIENRKKDLSWRLIISLREDDARELGYMDRDSWADLCRRSMIHFSRATGMKIENLNWVGAFHPEAGHPHVHLLIWSKGDAPSRKGLLTLVEKAKLDRGIATEIYAEYRHELILQKNLTKSTLLDETKGMVKEADLQRRIKLEMQARNPPETLPPKFTRKEIEELQLKMEKLAAMMPGKGRAVYAYMPPEVKEEVTKIAKFILARPQFIKALKKHEEATREVARINTILKEKLDISWEKEKERLELDIKNAILKIVKDYNFSREERIVPEVKTELAEKIVESFRNAKNKPVKYKEVNWTIKSMIKTMNVLGIEANTRKEVMESWLENSGLYFSKSKLGDILDSTEVAGVMDYFMGRENWQRLCDNLGIEVQIPWDLPAFEMKVHERRKNNAIEVLSTKQCLDNLNEDEKRWTAGAIYRFLSHLEVNNAEEIASRYGKFNVSMENERISHQKRAGINYISYEELRRIRDNLGISETELSSPWLAFQPQTEKKGILNIEFSVDKYAVNVFLKSLKESSELKGEDIKSTVFKCAMVLHSLGVDDKETILLDYISRSEASITPVEVKNIVAKVEMLDIKNYFMGKEKWENFCYDVGATAAINSIPWQFHNTKKYKLVKTVNLGLNAYRNVFRILDRERLKAEAEAALAKMQEEWKTLIKEKVKKKIQMGINIEEAYKNLEEESQR